MEMYFKDIRFFCTGFSNRDHQLIQQMPQQQPGYYTFQPRFQEGL